MTKIHYSSFSSFHLIDKNQLVKKDKSSITL